MSFITLSYVTLATSAKSPDGAIRRRCVMRNITEPLYITAAAGTLPTAPTSQAAPNSAFTPVTQPANGGWRAQNDVPPAPPPPPAIERSRNSLNSSHEVGF